jgi:hypothetical protein
VFAFPAALVGLALTDTWEWSLFAAAGAAAGAGDLYVTRRTRPSPTLRERAIGAVATVVATWLMVLPALLVLLLIVWVVLEPLT